MSVFAADGLTIQQFNEPAGGQVVFHLHFHVIPRKNGVALKPPASFKEDPAVLADQALAARGCAERLDSVGEGLARPRETRSISARTRRSTMPGRLSSSQAFSIGRSISRTRSSSVRAFCDQHGLRQRIEGRIDRGAGCARNQPACASWLAAGPAQRPPRAVFARLVEADIGIAVDGAKLRRAGMAPARASAAIDSVRSRMSAD